MPIFPANMEMAREAAAKRRAEYEAQKAEKAAQHEATIKKIREDVIAAFPNINEEEITIIVCNRGKRP